MNRRRPLYQRLIRRVTEHAPLKATMTPSPLANLIKGAKNRLKSGLLRVVVHVTIGINDRLVLCLAFVRRLVFANDKGMLKKGARFEF